MTTTSELMEFCDKSKYYRKLVEDKRVEYESGKCSADEYGKVLDESESFFKYMLEKLA